MSGIQSNVPEVGRKGARVLRAHTHTLAKQNSTNTGKKHTIGLHKGATTARVDLVPGEAAKLKPGLT